VLDSTLRKIIDPPLNKVGRMISSLPISANMMTLIGFGFGIIACGFVVFQFYYLALVFLILNRLSDGLDGAIARVKNQSSDFGGYLDIVLDFFIYAGFPLCVGIGLMDLYALSAAAFALFAIVTTGVSFLAYAIICAKRGLETSHQGKKTFYFSNGLMEGTETIIFLISLCLFPQYFVAMCFTFGLLCLITTALRIRMAYHVFA